MDVRDVVDLKWMMTWYYLLPFLERCEADIVEGLDPFEMKIMRMLIGFEVEYLPTAALMINGSRYLAWKYFYTSFALFP
jgi:hypothetical protein